MSLHAQTVPAVRLPEALWLLLAELDEPVRRQQIAAWIQSAGSAPGMFEGLRMVLSGSDIVGVVWAQVLDGRAGVLWPPRISADADPRVAAVLLDETQRFWLQREIRFVQVVLPVDLSHDDESSLLSHGFSRLTDLHYLACSTTPPSGDFRPRNGLQIHAFQERDRNELLRIMEATYVDTLDCPELDSVRPINEVLEGYMATGQSGSSFWYLAGNREKNDGCLLLADHRNGDFELVYVGLKPEVRGLGWGRQLTDFALRVAAEQGARRMLLAVDYRNIPAQNIYRDLGFTKWDARRVWVWTHPQLSPRERPQ